MIDPENVNIKFQLSIVQNEPVILAPRDLNLFLFILTNHIFK